MRKGQDMSNTMGMKKPKTKRKRKAPKISDVRLDFVIYVSFKRQKLQEPN